MSFVRRHRTAIVSVAVMTLASTVLVIYAITSDGYARREVRLNDGGVWVTNGDLGYLGRLNKPAGALDAGLQGSDIGAPPIDVLQENAAVLFNDGRDELLGLDPSDPTSSTATKISFDQNSQAALQGGTLAVVGGAKGDIRVGRVNDSTRVDLGVLQKIPQTIDPSTFVLTVSTDGAVFVVSGDGSVVEVVRAGGRWNVTTSKIPGLSSKSIAATTVGRKLVVLDSGNQKLYLPGRTEPVAVDGAAPVIQEPSDASGSVVVATQTSLQSYDLSTGSPKELYPSGASIKPAATQAPARPTLFGGCVYGAWDGSPSGMYARVCPGVPTLVNDQLTDSQGNPEQMQHPKFRVNRGFILLNNLKDGATFDLAQNSPKDLADWKAVVPVATSTTKPTDQNPAPNPQAQPPKLQPVKVGARPGRTTVLHFLDAASDPEHDPLAIVAGSVPGTLKGVAQSVLTVAPDAQTVELTLPADTPSQDLHVPFTVADRAGRTQAIATVHVYKFTDPDQAPNLPASISLKSHPWTVVAGGRLAIPVVGDWRDTEGDPVLLAAASTSGNDQVSTSQDGRLLFTASTTTGEQTIHYSVTDGISAATSDAVKVTVVANGAATPPVAEPDVVRARVGAPVVVHPLDNDVPGTDAATPGAALRLAARVPSNSALDVQTDLAAGALTITPKTAGMQQLSYSAAYGNSKYSTGKVEVEVEQGTAASAPPLAMPDTAVVYGQAPAVVDVLANDLDPSGRLLVVQHATPEAGSSLTVSVVQGRWLRITNSSSRVATTAKRTQVVGYEVGDGTGATVTSQVTVTSLDPPPTDVPVANDDFATVRAGDTVTVPVLDNDMDPAGNPLSLAATVKGAPAPGVLTVDPAQGAAYVSGNVVRYQAPANPTITSVNVQYTVTAYAGQEALGSPANGTIHIHITPAGTVANDHAPTPPHIDARVEQGSDTIVRIPTSNVDPDGDSVTVTGIAPAPGSTSGPQLGRVSAITPSSIEYQAFPSGPGGTDTFSYLVTDSFGLVGQATVSIAVVPVDVPQPPQALNDVVAAAPGDEVKVNVLENDLTTPGHPAQVIPMSHLPNGVTVEGPWFTVHAPANPKAPPVVVSYQVTDGITTSAPATLTVNVEPGYRNPPRAYDMTPVAKVGDTTVTADVKKKSGDYDPNGDDITVVSASKGTVSSGGVITVALTALPQTVSYVIRDAASSAGGAAIGVLHIPAQGGGGAYVKPGSVIQVDAGKSVTFALTQYVVEPVAGKQLKLTTSNTLSWAPTQPAGMLTLTAGSPTSLTVKAGKDNGPASITFQVTDGTTKSYLTIPVQIGPDVPVIVCPARPYEVTEGLTTRLPLFVACNVWDARGPAAVNALAYRASWTRKPANVDQSVKDAVLSVTASGAAAPGTVGQLDVHAGNSAAASLSVQVVKTALPTLSAVTINGVSAGKPQTVDLTADMTSPFPNPQYRILSVTQVSGGGDTVGVPAGDGPRVVITPASTDVGPRQFLVTATDEPNVGGRSVQGMVTLEVLHVPGAPTNLAKGAHVESGQVELTWGRAAANGAPLQFYEVDYRDQASGSSGTQNCAASPCAVVGLTNGHSYSFAVRAFNSEGFGPASNTVTAQPDHVPPAVTNLRATNPTDRALDLSWTEPTYQGSPVTQYVITWDNGGTMTITVTSAHIAGLVNDTSYTFTVVPYNSLGPGELPNATVVGQSAGIPAPMPAPTVPPEQVAGASSTTVAAVTWQPEADPNGAGTKMTYTVWRCDGQAACADPTALSGCVDVPITQSGCDDRLTNNGQTEYYAVTAKNDAGFSSLRVNWKDFNATGLPEAVGSFQSTPNDGFVAVSFTAPQFNGLQPHVNWSIAGSSGTWAVPDSPGSTVNEQIPVANGNTVTPVLTSCNKFYCAAPTSSSQPVTPRGPIKLTSVQASAVGDHVNWTVAVDPNGQPVIVTVTDSAGRIHFTSTPTGNFSQTFSDTALVGFSAHDTVFARVTDASGPRAAVNGQSGDVATWTPSVSVHAGSATKTGYCTVAACKWIDISASGFDPNTSYDLLFTDNCTSGCPGTGPSCPDYTVTGSSPYYACEVVTTDGNGNINIAEGSPGDRAFGYAGKTVTVDVGNPRIAGGTSGPF